MDTGYARLHGQARSGGNPIGDRILLHPIVGALTAASVFGVLYVAFGTVPNPGVIAGVMLIGVGVGMVVARYGNMGPFQGEFGSPWFEVALGESLRKEVARAARFDRDLSIVVVRQQQGPALDWAAHIREADEVIVCRNGWQVLILPETPKDGAQAMIERATAQVDVEVQAVIMDPSMSHNNPDKLGSALLDLVRNPPPASERGQSSVIVQRDTDRLQWPAG